MSADVQETPFSYPSLAGQGGVESRLEAWCCSPQHTGFNSSVPEQPQFPSQVTRWPFGVSGAHLAATVPKPAPPQGLWHPAAGCSPLHQHTKSHRFPGEQLPKSQKQRQSKGCGGCLVGGTSAPFISVSSSRLRKYLACRAPVPPTSTGIAQIFQLPAAGTSPGTEWIHPTSERCTRGARCTAAPRLLSARTPSPRQCRVLSPGWAPAGQRPGSPGHSSSFFTLQG